MKLDKFYVTNDPMYKERYTRNKTSRRKRRREKKSPRAPVVLSVTSISIACCSYILRPQSTVPHSEWTLNQITVCTFPPTEVKTRTYTMCNTYISGLERGRGWQTSCVESTYAAKGEPHQIMLTNTRVCTRR